MNLAVPVEFYFILETIVAIVAIVAIGIVLVKKHPKANKEQ